ncbi:MAG TPA: polysaccharide pyruvyl transferase family protein [Acidimicrobiia bacterium]|nr:polysaccharide pyruvyl transferase family protein [Acidimicrobiia bacterium]
MPAARIAVLGTFDVDNYGDHLFPRVARHEFGRRLPDAVVTPFAPYGALHPTGLDDGRPAESLGPWAPERARRLAADHHLVLVGGGELMHLNDPLLAPVYGASPEELVRLAPSRWFVEGLGPDLEDDCPVVWHAVGVPWAPAEEGAARLRGALGPRPYVTVRDRHSAERLVAAGVERPVDVVPDTALLIDRIMPAASLRARLDRLRAAGGYPPSGSPALVVQGCDLLLPHLEGVAAAIEGWLSAQRVPPEILALETGRCRGDTEFADRLARALGSRRVWRLPDARSVEDIAAAVAGGELFLGSSLHGAITALVYGRPFVLLHLFGDAKLDGFGDLTGLERLVVHHPGDIPKGMRSAAEPVPVGLMPSLQARIDVHFDRLADLAAERAAARADGGLSPARRTLLPAAARRLYGRLRRPLR